MLYIRSLVLHVQYRGDAFGTPLETLNEVCALVMEALTVRFSSVIVSTVLSLRRDEDSASSHDAAEARIQGDGVAFRGLGIIGKFDVKLDLYYPWERLSHSTSR